MSVRPHLLFVDDEPEILSTLRLTFEDDHEVSTALSGAEALEVLKERPVSLIMTDQRMPAMTGIELLARAREIQPDAVRIVLTAYTDIEALIGSINSGEVYRYLTKPWETHELVMTVKQGLERGELIRENRRLFRELKAAHEQLKKDFQELKSEVSEKYNFDQIISRSRAMQEIFSVLRRVSDSTTTILIEGETGTGKELIARSIHQHSSRRDKKFIVQNCGALPDNLLESELFGHKKGSFTGAMADKKGLFEEADRGTIFLDEISDTSPAMQVRLLRVLQEGEIRRVGENEPRQVDVRVISATNKNLEEEVKTGRFREDLYYRLNVLLIGLPALRERPEDIPLLAERFLSKFTRKSGRRVERIDEEAMRLLESYNFPGNVRELENEIERAVMLAGTATITPEVLSDKVRGERDPVRGIAAKVESLNGAVDSLKRLMINRALQAGGGNKTKAAELLGLTRQSLQQIMKRLGM